MTRTHELKILEQFADEIVEGNKMFEIRDNDRAYQKGDYIRFKAIHKNTFGSNEVDHEINEQIYKITYVLSGWGLKNGYVALGIREVDTDKIMKEEKS